MEEFYTAPPDEPRVAAETASCLVVYKPPRMHTAPLRKGEEDNLLAWIALRFPEVLNVRGRKDIEGGLVHRLDYETHGLVLCARTMSAMSMLLEQQEKGEIVKEYDACCTVNNNLSPPDFPPLPPEYELLPENFAGSDKNPAVIESAFRPYGKGRKSVRPVLQDNTRHNAGGLYTTEIISCTRAGKKCLFKIRIKKGFRHQIRCHLTWTGRPIVNDYLYGNTGETGFLALRACSIAFTENGQRQCFSLQK